jgi:hypothetical protein
MLADYAGDGATLSGRGPDRTEPPPVGSPRRRAATGGVVCAALVALGACFCASAGAVAAPTGARDAGAGCPVGWGGGVGKAGQKEAPTCQSVRRSFPSVQTGEVIVAVSLVARARWNCRCMRMGTRWKD